MNEASFLFGLLKTLMLVMSCQVLVELEKSGGQEKAKEKEVGCELSTSLSLLKDLFGCSLFTQNLKKKMYQHIFSKH